jgi:outer membrane protein insertion porin family
MIRLPSAIAVAALTLGLPAASIAEEALPLPPAEALPKASPENDPTDEARIAEVLVQGSRRVEAEAVKNALSTKAGAVFNAARVREDIRGLWRLGFFSDVQIFLDDTDPKRPVLVVQVVEKPAVREVKIRGNKELSDDDLKDIVDIKPFTILDLGAVQRNAKKLTDKYVEKGYYLAEVTPAVETLDNNEVGVFLDVNEHAKVQVKRITFVGNEKVPDADLKEVMQTDEGNVLSFLTSAGTYREEIFQRDLAQMQGVYYDRGFVHVRVGHPEVALSADKRFLYITVPITEGEQYAIGSIDFMGDLLVPKGELGARMTVTPGELFNRSKLQRDILALNDLYHDQGYAYVNISPQTTVDPEKKVVDLTFDIQKGGKVTIERIEIQGNHKTRDKVIRRELRIYEGELFTGTGMRLSRQRVTALGFFESVDVNFKKGASDTAVVVTVTVKEQPTGTFQVGFGISNVENFIFTAQIAQNNLFGWGQTASLAAQISSLRSLIQLSYVDPYFFDSRWIFSFNYFRQELDYGGFIRRSNGGDITWGYHLTEDLSLNLGYVVEAVSVEPGRSFGAELVLANRFRDGLTSSVRSTLNWDKRDNRLFPTSGFLQSLTLEHSTPLLGATFVFTRYSANSRWYYPLFLGLVAKAQAQLGFIQGENIPISELYFAGGINTLRGYALRTVAPTVRIGTEKLPDASLFEFPIGGNKQLIFNFELEFPIFEKVGIRGVLFYDMGNTYAESQGFVGGRDKSLPLGLLQSLGFGFRWFSPIGPLRFEWGVPLTRRPQDESILFEFTIGNFF